ncbi:hypothetical protein [Streptomyces sp. NBC_01264]|uniref:hypothetical protein n=1 Tax=Streptomyces sp. NBC_01264 TaxID=2903804 RepID=UPI002252D5BF|nr:hypothetical protein [Streptomyces sp. NBC_01264]MCX4780090.1 hypothetical protein [Streptomyces sp. NBC_01264]
MNAFSSDATATSVEACRRADQPPLTPGSLRVLVQIQEMKVGQDENYIAFLNLLASHIWEAGDATAVLAQVQDIILAARAPARPCTVHAWCVETGDHFEHYSKFIEAPTPDHFGNPVLSAGLTDFRGTTIVGLLDLDLTPAAARIRIAELRTHLDNVEALVTTAEASAG